jgi:chromate reductase, NAD(P)H dehydrogenase (quinone)
MSIDPVTTHTPVHILGLCGSLRSASYNGAALQAAAALLPEGSSFSQASLADLPVFNQDHEHPLPASVVALKQQIRAADAVLIATPEYNYSVPGVLKNAIDWASRPYGDSAWAGKPVAILSASVGALGGARAQYHLRQMFVYLDMPVVNHPEVMIGHAGQVFDPNGSLTQTDSLALIRELLVNLVRLARQLHK